jgi:hypothetical protein
MAIEMVVIILEEIETVTVIEIVVVVVSEEAVV